MKTPISESVEESVDYLIRIEKERDAYKLALELISEKAVVCSLEQASRLSQYTLKQYAKPHPQP